MEWSGTYGKQIRGGLSPAFKEQLKYFNSDSPQEEDSDSTEQEQHTAAEIRAKLKDAIEYSKREDEEDGDKTSYIKLIMIALDHLVATQEKHRIELKTMSDPMHRYVLRILDKQVNETSAPSPTEIPSTPKVARTVHFDNNEAPNSYGDINAP